MTAYRFVTITCDGCGEVFDPGQARSVKEARLGAEGEGWVMRRYGHHYEDRCGICCGTHYRTAYGYERYPRE